MPSSQDLAGNAEIAKMLGVSRQRVTQIVAAPDFPEPLATLAMGKVWDAEQVRAWARSKGRTIHE